MFFLDSLACLTTMTNWLGAVSRMEGARSEAPDSVTAVPVEEEEPLRAPRTGAVTPNTCVAPARARGDDNY